VIFGFSNNGIDIAKSDGGKAFIVDTISQDNGNVGLQSANTSTTVNVVVDRSRFENNMHGVLAGSFSNFSVRDSDASGNSSVGFFASANLGAAQLDISNSIAASNSSGIFAGNGAAMSTVRMSGVSLYNNTNGLFLSSNGQILSYGNNYNDSGGTPSGPASPGPQ